jgi:hypothetical protein
VWYLRAQRISARRISRRWPTWKWQIASADINLTISGSDLAQRRHRSQSVWYLNGMTFLARILPPVVDPSWQLAAAMDVKG